MTRTLDIVQSVASMTSAAIASGTSMPGHGPRQNSLSTIRPIASAMVRPMSGQFVTRPL